MKQKSLIFHFAGRPVYIHISILAAFAYFIYLNGPIAGVIATFAFILMMLAHELGHAYYVTRYRHELVEINVYPLHGECLYDIDERWLPETLIIAGGILAQLALLLVWLSIIGALNMLNLWKLENLLEPITDVFIRINIITMILNLLPIEGLDGKILWVRLLGYFQSRNFFKPSSNKQKIKPGKQSAEKVVDLAIKKAQRKK